VDRPASQRLVALLSRALPASIALKSPLSPSWESLADTARAICRAGSKTKPSEEQRRERARAFAARALAHPDIRAAAEGKDLARLWEHVAEAILPDWMPGLELRVGATSPGAPTVLWAELANAEGLAPDRVALLFEVAAAFAECVPTLAGERRARATIALWPGRPRARIELVRECAGAPPSALDPALTAALGEIEDAVVELTSDGRILYISERATLGMGFPMSHFVGRTLDELVSPADRERVIDAMQGLGASSSAVTTTFQMFDAEGVVHDMEARAIGFTTQAGARRIVAVVRGVGGNARREQALRDDIEQLRDLAHFGDDIAFEIELDGSTRAVHARGKGFASIAPDARFAEHIFQRAVDGHAVQAAGAYVSVREGRGSQELDVRLRLDDGSERWFAAGLHPISAGASVRSIAVRLRDITQRKSYEGALRDVAESAFDGGSFETLVGHVARAMGLECALVVVPREEGRAEVATLWCDGAFGDEIEFELAGSPFESVLAGQAACYSIGVSRRFAALPALPGGPYSSFVGAPLLDEGGAVIGCLAALGRSPITNIEIARTTLAIFAQRAAAELRRAEVTRALSESEARMRAILDQSPDLIVDADAETGVRYVSPSVERTLGTGSQDGSILDRVDPARRNEVLKTLRSAYDSPTPVRVITRIRNRDDAWLWVEVSARGYRTQSGRRRMVIIGRDITDRRLEEGERRQLMGLMESSSDLMAICSLDGEITFLNSACRALIGGTGGSAPARLQDWLDLQLAGESFEQASTRIRALLARDGGFSQRAALRQAIADADIPVIASAVALREEPGAPAAALAIVCRDARAELETKQALLETARRVELIERGAHHSILELDREGRVTYASPNSARVLGIAPEELVGSIAFDRLLESEQAVARQTFEQVLQDASAAFDRTVVVDSSGRAHPLEVAIAPSADIDGRLRAVVVARDLSESELAQARLRESEERLLQAQKMEAVGRLAGGIAHDFNNLLTAIIGHADLLLDDLGENHPSAEDAREVLHAANRAAGLTRQLLAFSRRQVLDIRPVDLNALISQLDRMLRRVVGERYSLVAELDGSLWPVSADAGQIEQVVLNLVVNARDAMPDGGTISLRTENWTLPHPLETTAGEAPPGEYAGLSVVDSGCGISTATAARIFEPFFTTKRPGEGTGLGLSTVLGIVEQSGGHVLLDSAEGRGSCFTVLLPRAVAEVREPDAPADMATLHGDGTVLVVEDEPAVRALVVRHLSESGYTVLEATDGDGALEVCRTTDRLDLLLTDVVLPSYDGPAIAECVRAIFPDTAVAYLSGFPDAALERHGIAPADVRLLSKPFSRGRLLAFVADAIADARDVEKDELRELKR